MLSSHQIYSLLLNLGILGVYQIMDFIQQNIHLILLTATLVIIFLYGRYQYIKGKLAGLEDGDMYGITASDYENMSERRLTEGYINGFKAGIEKTNELNQHFNNDNAWIDEAEEWRSIIKSIVVRACNVEEVKN